MAKWEFHNYKSFNCHIGDYISSLCKDTPVLNLELQNLRDREKTNDRSSHTLNIIMNFIPNSVQLLFL